MPENGPIMLPKLYYISQGSTLSEHFININNALTAGVKMIQIRLKELIGVSNDSWFEEILRKCKMYEAYCIINDFADLAISIHADGVHVGREDEKPIDIMKKTKSNKFIIGATANNYSEFEKCLNQPINYIGLGPVRHTSTKKKLSPILGIEGIHEIISNFQPLIPVYAIGGIQLSDVKRLMHAGCYGVAISADLSMSDVELLKKKVEAYNNVLYGG
jgi:thiamine-phosphate pyrophosphorylase